MDENAIPVAQGPEAGQDTPGEQSTEQESSNPAVPTGFQARINELTAARREAERRVSEQEKQIAELVRLASANVQRAPVEPKLPELEIDPDQQKILDAYRARYVNPEIEGLKQTIKNLTAQFGSARAQEAAETMVGDPEVAQRASQLIQGWQQAGLQGWTAEDAVKYAAGEKAIADLNRTRQAKGARQQFNGQGTPVVTGHSTGQPPNPVGTLPANFDSLPVEKQLEILEKRGVHGKAI